MHVMLGRKLTSSEILDLASFTDLISKGTYQAEATAPDPQRTYQAENTAFARRSPGETAKQNDRNIKYDSGARHDTDTECACVMVHKEYSDVFLNTSLGATNGRRLASEGCQEEKDAAVFRNMAYESEGGQILRSHHQIPVLKEGKFSSLDAEGQEVTDSSSVTAIAEQKMITTFDILQWLRNNDMATISHIVNAFRYCEAKHLMFLLLEMLERSIIVEQEGMLRIASEQASSRLAVPTKSSQAWSNPLINKRMHRALCLKAVVLNVVIHEPKKNVEFVIRHVKAYAESTVYHVQICKYPSCTCPDHVMGLEVGLDYYRPCKHLFYVYLVQLHLEKNLEHLMLQRTLEEEDLERILEGHY